MMSSNTADLHFSTGGMIGAKLYQVDSSKLFDLGTCVMGTDNTEWVYVEASGTITVYDVVAIDEDYQAAACSSALAGAGHTPGFAQQAFTDGQFGWVALKGSNIKVRAASSCAADALLYVGTTGLSNGVVDDASASGRVTLQGVVLVEANTSSTTTALEIIATNPIFLNV
ncbi:MAG: hypothetical protein MN733_04055 [Nitrososphaera sp.]|nr:hypothetical protein [Nitrososphaera sp.]